MKMVVSNPEEAKELLQKLQIEEFRSISNDEKDWFVIQKVHSKYWYHLVGWLQKQGYQTLLD